MKTISFDGVGLNSTDKYSPRIATFVNDPMVRTEYGKAMVVACNAHDELIAMLRRLTDAVASGWDVTPLDIEQARAALAKAGAL